MVKGKEGARVNIKTSERYDVDWGRGDGRIRNARALQEKLFRPTEELPLNLMIFY